MTKCKERRKEKVGLVVSDKMNKTRLIEVKLLVKQPVYGKMVRKSFRFKAHDEENDTKIGDKVKIRETRPLSKEKRWKIIEKIDSNAQ